MRRCLLDVEWFGADRITGSVERDFLHPRFGLPQQILATALECLAALVDGHRFLERHLAVFEPPDDRFKFLDRPFERELSDVGVALIVVLLRHERLSDSLFL